MIHAATPGFASWSTDIYVAQDGWTPSAIVVGTVQQDQTTAPLCSSQYHVHQDFMPSTTGTSCLLNKNTTLAPIYLINPTPNQMQTGIIRTNSDNWVHSLTHQFNAPCYDLGPAVGDILMGPGGILDQAGVSYLANCTPSLPDKSCWRKTPSVVTLPGTSWHGYIVVDESVFRGAMCVDMGKFSAADCLRAMAEVLPDSGNTMHVFRYGPDSPGYYFQLWWVMDNYQGRAGDCVSVPTPITVYWVDFKNFAQITCNAQVAGAMPNPNAPGVTSYGWYADGCCGLPTTWSQYQGAGGANPSAIKNITRTDWRPWAQNMVQYNWPTLQSEMLTIIRQAHGWHALAQIEITAGNAGPDFECKDQWPSTTDPSTWNPDYSEACRKYFTSQNP